MTASEITAPPTLDLAQPVAAAPVLPLAPPVLPLEEPVLPLAPAVELIAPARGQDGLTWAERTVVRRSVRSRRTTPVVRTWVDGPGSRPVVVGAVSGLVGAVATGLLLPGTSTPALAALALLWTVLLVLASGHVARAAVVLGAGSWAVSTLAAPPVGEPVLLAFSAAVAGLAALHGWVVEVRRAGRTTRVVVVGSPTAVRATLAQLAETPGHGLEVGAVCLTGVGADPAPLADLEVPTHTGLESLAPLVEDVEAVLALPGPDLEPRTLRRLGWQLDACGTQLLVGTGLIGLGPARTRTARAGEIGLLAVRPVRHGGPGRWTKAAWERAAAVLALVLLAPLLTVLVLAIRHGSPGPAVFRQTRVGRGGRVFTMFKLRTMTADAEQLEAALRTTHGSGQVLFKLAQDPRVTPVGRWLRRYSLDELPQLVNVALGHMALVGPRPALPSEVLGYDAYPRRRLAVKPGLTGLWQVSGRSDLSWEDAVRLDLDYVDNWSLARDLTIIARTVGAVVRHRGAY